MKNALSMLVVLTLLSDRASAVLIVDEGFDNYDNQAQLEAVWTPIGTVAPFSGELALFDGVSPPSVRYPRASSDGQHRNQLTFTPTPLLGVGDELVWSFDYYDHFPIGRPNPNYATLQTVATPGSSPAGQLVSMGLNNNQFQDESGGNFYMASVAGYSHTVVDPDGGPPEDAVGTGPGVYFKLNDTGVGLRGENPGWHNLKLVISSSDGTMVDHAYYVDSVLAETVSGVGPVQQYGVMRLGSGLLNGVQVSFDNIRLEFISAAIPEASSSTAVGLVGLLSAGAVWIRKRRASRAAA